MGSGSTPALPDPRDEDEPRDPGLARERTELAWTRTAISYAALGTAMLRTSTAAGLIVLTAAAGVWGLGRLSARRATPGDRSLSPRRMVRSITLATTAISVLALVLALVATPHRRW